MLYISNQPSANDKMRRRNALITCIWRPQVKALALVVVPLAERQERHHDAAVRPGVGLVIIGLPVLERIRHAALRQCLALLCPEVLLGLKRFLRSAGRWYTCLWYTAAKKGENYLRGQHRTAFDWLSCLAFMPGMRSVDKRLTGVQRQP